MKKIGLLIVIALLVIMAAIQLKAANISLSELESNKSVISLTAKRIGRPVYTMLKEDDNMLQQKTHTLKPKNVRIDKSSAAKKYNALEKQSDRMAKEGETALIIIDLQNDYFSGGAMQLVEAEAAADKTKAVLAYFRNKEMPVIHVKHIALQKGATFFLPDTKGAEIYKSVLPLPTEKVIIKNYPNSFRNTELLAYLKYHQIKNLVICGMMTDVCVDATVRASMDYGFKNIVISDAVATRNRDLKGEIITAGQVNLAYLAGLNALGGLYAAIFTADEFILKR